MMTYRALCTPILGVFKGVLDGTFHEFFGAPSAPFIASAPSTGQFSYLLSGLGTLSDLDVLSGIGTLSSPAPSVVPGVLGCPVPVMLMPSLAQCPHWHPGPSSVLASSAVRPA